MRYSLPSVMRSINECLNRNECCKPDLHMNFEKENFLRTKFISVLQQLGPSTSPRWGKMNVQQMIEHFAEMFRWANGKIKHENILTRPEQLQAFRDFMMSERLFKENTKNKLMGEEPEPV